jgi:hypothetical protein
MTTRLNRYYNDPNIAAAVSNLSSLFEPPAPQDMLAYSALAKQQAEAAQLAEFQRLAQGGAAADVLDRAGVAAGLYDPTGGFGARDMASADRRYGADTSAAASRYGSDRGYAASVENNLRDNQRAAVTDLFGPLNPGQVAPAVPDDLMEALDLPGVAQRQGLAPILSQDEVMAQILGDTYALNPQALQTATQRRIGSDFNIEEVLDPQGNPTMLPRDQAVGMAPYTPAGSTAAVEPVQWLDGQGGVGGRGTYDRNSGSYSWEGPIPPVTAQIVNVGNMEGTPEDYGVTTANMTEGNRAAADAVAARSLLAELRANLESKPGQYGIAGAAQMIAQDIRQTTRELSAALGERGLDDPVMLDEIGAFAGSVANTPGYDPSFRELRAKLLELAYTNARLNNPSGEVSRFALERELDALSQGFLANDASLDAALNAFEDRITRAELRSDTLRRPNAPAEAPTTAPAPAAPAAARPRAENPQTGEIIEWDGQAWVPAN